MMGATGTETCTFARTVIVALPALVSDRSPRVASAIGCGAPKWTQAPRSHVSCVQRSPSSHSASVVHCGGVLVKVGVGVVVAVAVALGVTLGVSVGVGVLVAVGVVVAVTVGVGVRVAVAVAVGVAVRVAV